MRFLYLIIILMLVKSSIGQKLSGLDTIGKFISTSNLYSVRLTGDSLSTSFCIVIKNEVKAHKHVRHSEQVVVIEGEAEMMLGKEKFTIRKGDLIFIPKNTVHSVRNTGSSPLKMLSIQSPAFNGDDRILVE
jgi:mannose-6-phosphate isomerase-like protein (cupin superfamily)